MGNIKKELTIGVLYTAIAKYSSIIISLIISAILARLLTPQDFGIIAIALIMINFFNMFSDLGMGSAIIQKKLTKNDLSQIFSFTIWIGIFLSITFFLCSWSIASYYNIEQLISICQLLSINIFFASINIVPSGLLQKNKRFKFIALRTFLIQLIIGAISCILAYNGFGIYSLLITPILSSIILFIINYRQYPLRFTLKFNFKPLKYIFSYSIYQFSFNLFNYLSSNIDKLLIGKFLGMTTLGYYEKSYRLMMLPLSNITNVITPVMHPIFSIYQNNYALLSNYYLKIIRFLAFIGFPLSVYLYFTAQELVLLIFGKQWIESIHPFQILSISVGFQIIMSSSNAIFQAADTTKAMFFCGLFSSTINFIGILLGIFIWKSVTIIAWCMVIGFFISFIQRYWYMYYQMFSMNMFIFIKALLSPLFLATILTLVLFLFTPLFQELNLILSFVTKTILSLLTFGLYIHFGKIYNLKRFSIRNITQL